MKKLLCSLVVFFGCIMGISQVSAAVTSTGLLLEYKFLNNFNDTSGRNKTLTGANVTFGKDDSMNLNYASFNNATLKTNMGWSTDGYGSYTISFWYKSNLGNAFNLSTDKGGLFSVSSNSCNFAGVAFNCTNVVDDKWHSVIIQKNGRFNKVYIDGKKAYDDIGVIGVVGYNFSLYGASGSFSNFRFYDNALSIEDMSALFAELAYLQISFNSSAYVNESTGPALANATKFSIIFDATANANQRCLNNPGTCGLESIFSTAGNANWEWNNRMNLTLNDKYICGTPIGEFDCSVLKDAKEHQFFVRYSGKNLDIYIDDILRFSKEYNGLMYGPSLTLMNSIATQGTIYSAWGSYGMQGIIQNGGYLFYNASAFGGTVTNFKSYDGYMGDKQKSEFKPTNVSGTGVLSNTGILNDVKKVNIVMQSIQNDILTFALQGMTGFVIKERADYDYSFDKINFIKVDTGSITDYNGSYIVPISLQQAPFGDNVLSLYANVSGVRYLLGTINFKREKSLDILINQPNTSDSSSKSISATFNSTGTLFMSLTRGNVCSNTLTFEPYNDMTFTSPSDNGTRVCYKAIEDVTKKEIYKLSDPIKGIQGNGNMAYGGSIFDTYKSWNYSKTIRNNDITFNVISWLPTLWSSPTNINFIDINGDGLADVIYKSDAGERAILTNNGDYTFKVSYKCKIDSGYYGDCADMVNY